MRHSFEIGPPLRGLAAIALVVAAAAAPGAVRAAEVASAKAGWRETVRAFAAEHFHNPAWGYSHSQRDYALAREMAAADHVVLDDDVLYAASYLHDLAAFKPWEDEKLDHADVAAGLVEGILKDTGFPMTKIDAVRGAIRTHMYDRDPAGAEAVYLHDADALDWLGAIGVARIIALVDANGGKPTGPEIIPMLEHNLADVPARVMSAAGRARVAQRRAELETFLRDLKRETDDLHTL